MDISQTRNCGGIIVATIYLPEGWKPLLGKQLYDYLSYSIDQFKIEYKNSTIIILGDFNRWNHSTLCKQFSLKQLIRFKTFYFNDNDGAETATLDLIITDLTKYYQDPQELPPLGKSRHKSILLLPYLQHNVKTNPKAITKSRPVTTKGLESLTHLLRAET